jgi:RNA recognition motif-containing protein
MPLPHGDQFQMPNPSMFGQSGLPNSLLLNVLQQPQNRAPMPPLPPRPPQSNSENSEFLKNFMPLNVTTPFTSSVQSGYPQPPLFPNYPGSVIPPMPNSQTYHQMMDVKQNAQGHNQGGYQIPKLGQGYPQSMPPMPYGAMSQFQANMSQQNTGGQIQQQPDRSKFMPQQQSMQPQAYGFPGQQHDQYMNPDYRYQQQRAQIPDNRYQNGYNFEPTANTQQDTRQKLHESTEGLDENSNGEPTFNVWDISDEEISKSIILVNLKEGTTEEATTSILSSIGELESIKFLTQSNGRPFVIATFKHEESVSAVFAKTKSTGNIHRFSHDILRSLLNETNELTNRAIQRLHNPEIMAKLLCNRDHLLNYFHFILSKKPLAFYGNSIRVREIWIGNLPSSITEQSLSKELSVFGEIDNIDLFSKHQSFAFVRFVTADSATRCLDGQDQLSKTLGQVKISYSDFLKRFNITGDGPFLQDNSSRLTNVLFIGIPFTANLPSESVIIDKFGQFGKVVNILNRPSLNETHKSYMLVEMETKEQARKVRKHFFIEDRDGKRRAKLSDKKMEINVILKPNVNGNLYDAIAPYLNLKNSWQEKLAQSSSQDKNALLNELLFGTSALKAPTPKSEAENLIWTGFISKNRKNMIGADASYISGNDKELLDDSMYLLNISHKASMAELFSKKPVGIVCFRASNVTYEHGFAELNTYFREKNICGVIKNLEKSVLYIAPATEQVSQLAGPCRPNDLVGFFFALEEESVQALPQSNQEII